MDQKIFEALQADYNMLNHEENFYWICVVTETWKEMGWSSIIFLAAISGINREIYEAATVDGASRLQKILYITLPNLTGAVVIMFMFSFSGLLSGGGGAFDQSYFLGNPLTLVSLSTPDARRNALLQAFEQNFTAPLSIASNRLPQYMHSNTPTLCRASFIAS